MKIRVNQYSTDRLKLSFSGYGCAFTIGAILLFAGSWFSFWAMGDRIVVEVDDQTLSYDRKLLGLIPRESFVAKADELETVDVQGYITITQVVEAFARTTDGKEQKIWLPSYDGDEKRWFVTEVNRALATKDGTFRVVQNAFLTGVILGGSCLFGGLYVLFHLQTICVIGNKHSLTLVSKRTLWPTGSRVQIDRDQITGTAASDVTVGSIRTGTPEATSYSIYINTRDGKQHPIGYGPMFTAEAAQRALDVLDAWLTGQPLPAADEDPDTEPGNEKESEDSTSQQPTPFQPLGYFITLTVFALVIFACSYLAARL